MKKFAVSAAAWLLIASASFAGNGDKRPNILFIAIDDLRPELGCYGADHIKSPNIDRVATEGVLFKRAYCQAPHCAPSRASLLSGVHTRNAGEKVWSVEQLAPGKPSLPATFREAGYYTVGNGKIFHQREDDAENSWSETPFSLVNGPEGNNHGTFHNPASAKYISARGRGPYFEAADVPDNAYIDGQTCEKVIHDLRRLSKMDQPFFLTCGFVRPHLPFYAPKKYWDLYDHEALAIADNRSRPKNAPSALTGSGEIRRYSNGGIAYNSDEFHKFGRHGYYACVSYVDALVGKLLAELDKLGLRENTIVVVWGDHGWNLGEHDFWGKHNLLHKSTHAPLIISAPGYTRNASTDGIVELVDLYPTLCELAGLTPPEHLEGQSMVPLLRDPRSPGKEAAFTTWKAGLVATTRDFTYTEYNGQPGMLYDHRKDPEENVNVLGDPRYAETVREMRKLIHSEGVEEARENVVEIDGMRFIDADERNTVVVDAPDTAFSTPAANPGDLWRKRPGTGFDMHEAKEIYERISGEPPMLKTTVRDLEPGTEVGVYVGFISNPSRSWRIRAGFEADQIATYTPTSPDGRIVDRGAMDQAVAHQYLGLIGDATVRPDGSLDVFIAHGNGKGGPQRTMYEGVAIGPPTGKAATPVLASGYEGQVPPPTYSELSYGPHERNTLDFWKADSDAPTPLVMVIHGGGWMGGSKERMGRFADPVALLNAGISVAAINYRLIPQAKDVEPPVKAPMMDSARALQFLRSKAKELNIDPTRIGAAGGSAGACTALWLAYHDDLADPYSDDPVARESTRLSVVAVRGPQTSLDPKQMKEWTPNITYGGHAFGKKNFDQFLADREAILPWIAEFSPYAQVDAGDPPSCLFYGAEPNVGKGLRNATHSPNFGAMFQKRCQEVGVPCQVVYHEDASAIARGPTEYLIEILTAER